MDLTPTANALFCVFMGIFGILIAVSLMGWLLKTYRFAYKPERDIDAFNGRIKAWWGMVIFVWLAIQLGTIGITVLFGFISFQCLREYISVMKTRISDHYALVWSFYFFLPAQYVLIALDQYMLFSILIPVFAFLFLPICSVLRGDTKHFLARAAQVHWGLMICVYFLSHVPALMLLQVSWPQGVAQVVAQKPSNVLLILFLMLVVQGSYMVQYMVDKLLGRHPFKPGVFAAYTYEGLIAGVLGAALIGGSLWWITPFMMWQAMAIALLLGSVGVCGKFVLLAIKRDRGVNNWGLMNQSHNGMLDMVDAIGFAAPTFYYIVRYFWCLN